MNTVDNLNPARYAAQLAETIGSLHRHLAAKQPDWWQQVVDELHSRLDKEFPPFYDCQECGAALYAAFATCEECGHKFNQGADVIPPWKGGDAPVEQPDYFQLPGMEHKRMDLMDWRFNGIEERLGTLESNASAFRLSALEERLSALEDWADIKYAPGDDAPVDGIHALIAEGMTGVTADMHEHVARELAHTDDALLLEIQALRALLDETQDLVKAVLKITALETKSAL